MPDRLFVQLGVLVLIATAAMRLVDLGLVPLHHDEGINGWFVTNLARQGTWAYDPANYHGPTLFYLALVSEIAFGLSDEAMRLVPVLFGIGIVALTLALRPLIGSWQTILAAALLAVSPGATYVARYFIHESLVAFFTLAIVVAVLYLLRTRKQRYLVAAAGAVALLLATKETGIAHIAVLAIAAGFALVYMRLRGRDPLVVPPSGAVNPRSRAARTGRDRIDWRTYFTTDGVGASALTFLVLYALFFTSFLSNPEGLVDSLGTFTIWTQTGGETQVQPFGQYIIWMLRGDAPILLLGFVGGVLVAWRSPSLSAVFTGLWALGMTLAYSLITYKTPWIALNMLVPLAILAGIAVPELVVATARRVPSFSARRTGAAAVAAAALAFSTLLAYDMNFVRYDDETYPYVFVHTTREAVALVDETKRIAAAHAGGERPGITVMSPEYWPLPWYYRDYPEAVFHSAIVETEEEMIVARADQEADPALQAIVNGRYQRRGAYTLRPGVELLLFVRNGVAGT
jgi:uncharacterized protein (TIGR03663 family)